MSSVVPTASSSIRRVAIYDDSADDRESLAETVEDAAFEPVIIANSFASLETCIDSLSSFDAALIDHRLSVGNFGDFKGAAAVKGLYLRRFPALLVTGWSIGDREDIQPYRRHLACVLQKGQYEADTVRDGLELCLGEFQSRYSSKRRPTKTIVRIASDFSGEEGFHRVDAFLPSWDPKQGITFPVEVVPEELRTYLTTDRRFLADVNTGADSQDELFFENFELAPEPQNAVTEPTHN